jgi:hypothetical protein
LAKKVSLGCECDTVIVSFATTFREKLTTKLTSESLRSTPFLLA